MIDILTIAILQIGLGYILKNRKLKRRDKIIFAVSIMLAYWLYKIFEYYKEKKPNLFEIMHTPRYSNSDMLNKNYRDLVKKYHPDKNRGDDNAKEKFIEIREIYETLKDDTRRTLYDRVGENSLNNAELKEDNIFMDFTIYECIPYYAIWCFFAYFFSSEKNLESIRLFLALCILFCMYEISLKIYGTDTLPILEFLWPKYITIYERGELLRIIAPTLLTFIQFFGKIFKVECKIKGYAPIQTLKMKQRKMNLLLELLQSDAKSIQDIQNIHKKQPELFIGSVSLVNPFDSNNQQNQALFSEGSPQVEQKKGYSWYQICFGILLVYIAVSGLIEVDREKDL